MGQLGRVDEVLWVIAGELSAVGYARWSPWGRSS